ISVRKFHVPHSFAELFVVNIEERRAIFAAFFSRPNGLTGRQDLVIFRFSDKHTKDKVGRIQAIDRRIFWEFQCPNCASVDPHLIEARIDSDYDESLGWKLKCS